MTQPPTYDPYAFSDALAAAKDALLMEPDDPTYDQALGRRLVQTEVTGLYRPYAAAFLWLQSNPKWFEKAEGVERRSIKTALYGLKAEQISEDARLGVIVPEHLTLKVSNTVPGPGLSAWE